MTDLSLTDWLVLSVISIALTMVILHSIIKSASNSKNITSLLEENNRLLKEFLDRTGNPGNQ